MKVVESNIIVEDLVEDSKSVGGLIMPKKEDAYIKAKVVEVAPETDKFKPAVKSGDIILYPRLSGTKITVDNKDYKVLDHKFILVVL